MRYFEEVVVRKVGLRDKEKVQTIRVEQIYVTKPEQIPEFLEWVKPLKVVGYDTETSGISVYDHQVATIQFGNPLCAEPRAYTFCVRSLGSEALRPVLDILWDRKKLKLGQNIKFECLYALHRLGQKVRGVIDTQVTELVLRAGLFPGGKTDENDGANRKAYSMTSMDALCKRYLGITIDKALDLRTSFYITPPGQLNKRQISYANGDVIYPFYIFEQQLIRVDERKLRSILRLEYDMVPILSESELAGVSILREDWTKLWQEACHKQAEAEQRLDALFLQFQGHLFEEHQIGPVRPLYVGGASSKAKPSPLNWGSASQVRWAIRQYCAYVNWPVQVLTTGKDVHKHKLVYGRDWMERKGLTTADVAPDTTDFDELDGRSYIPDFVLPEEEFCILLDGDMKTLQLRSIRGQLPPELVDALVEYGEQKALVSTFGVDFLNKNLKADGKIHTEFHQVITSTGRLATSPNLQNIPKEDTYRRCFVPRAGYRFVIADYSQIEPRISAQVSQDPIYLGNYRVGARLYTSIGERLFGRTIDRETPQGKEDDEASKAIVLALAYRSGPNKLRDQVTLGLKKPISFDQAKQWHSTYFKECSGILAFQDAQAFLASPVTGQKVWDEMLGAEVTYVTSPCGRHRFFPPGSKNTYTESANHPIQGCSATITKAASVMIQRYIDDNNIDAVGVNFVHDEIVYEVRNDQADAFAITVKDRMEAAGKFYLPDVPCVAEFPKHSNGVMPYWSKALDE